MVRPDKDHSTGSNAFFADVDIKTAFLYGDLDEEIWMNPPPGIGLDGKVLRLRKALYGLKQAPLKWYEKLSSVLAKLVFSPSAFDPCVHISKSKQTFVVVYVDDITVAGTKSAIDTLVSGLKREFSVSVKGPLSWILSIKVQQTPDGLYLTQQQYIRQTLDRFGMLDCKSVLTPLDSKVQLHPAHPDEKPVRQTEYQSITGCINYLVSCTRPDLAHAYSVLSSFNSCPTEAHHQALKRCLRYLSGTQTLGLFYPRRTTTCLTGYTDASYGNCNDTHRSWSGHCFFLEGSCISWSSTRQKTVATSTMESEYMSMAKAARQAHWYRTGLHELGITIPIKLYADNTAAISLARNPVLSDRSRHIDISYHFVRESVINKKIDLDYIDTASNPADIFTKALVPVTHNKFRDFLGVAAEREC